MKTTDVREARQNALKLSKSGFTEFVCTSCNKSFFFVNESKMWENYGVYLHTVCLHCGFVKEFTGRGFKQIEHHIGLPP